MKAILMTEPGPPEVLRPAEVETPDISGPHDLLIRLHAAGINPVDTKLRSRGTYYPERMPAILGCDGAGVVERVGSGVERFRP
ncbi:MAG TPA: alcohol dehydrogenase catalytic domain-containing protein, partial [Arenicellales bacterium]|nr:alcohol dehydrogenase catalytic domain-containing protein [Arenicellales bacterium]